MDNGVIYEIAASNPNMCDIDRLVNLYWGLSSVLVAGVPGAVVEVGCNVGKTSVFLQMIIDHFDATRELHLYDGFQGLPAPGVHDAYLKQGECPATVEEVRQRFEQRGLRQPHIHEGWFEESLARRCPAQICFAYLDGDFYDSIMTSWRYIYPRLAPSGIAIVDDYCDRSKNKLAWDGLPGVKKACDDFFADKPEKLSVLVGTGDLPFAMLRRGR